MNNLKKFSIKEINKVISELIDSSFYILFEIKGIVYNLNIVDNNAYLTLKNKDYKLNAVIWSNIYEKNKEIKNKDILICKAKLKYFEKKCKFFLIIEDYNIKKKKNNKSYENNDIKQYINSICLKKKKKKILKYNTTIAVITSIYGAALRDIISVINKNNKNTKILIYDIRVQGNNKKDIKTICDSIKELNQYNRYKIDVIILSRGGGSLEDLEYFNNINILKSIYFSNIPIISGIGHESDFTLVDFISDKHAITPSMAADIASYKKTEIIYKLDNINDFLKNIINFRLEYIKNKINLLKKNNIIKEYNLFLNYKNDILHYYDNRLEISLKNSVINIEDKHKYYKMVFNYFNPNKIFYNKFIFYDPDGNIIYTLDELKALSNMELLIEYKNKKAKININCIKFI